MNAKTCMPSGFGLIFLPPLTTSSAQGLHVAVLKRHLFEDIDKLSSHVYLEMQDEMKTFAAISVSEGCDIYGESAPFVGIGGVDIPTMFREGILWSTLEL